MRMLGLLAIETSTCALLDKNAGAYADFRLTSGKFSIVASPSILTSELRVHRPLRLGSKLTEQAAPKLLDGLEKHGPLLSLS